MSDDAQKQHEEWVERNRNSIIQSMEGVVKEPSAFSPLEQSILSSLLFYWQSRELHLVQEVFQEYELIRASQKLLDRAITALTAIRDRGTIEPQTIGEILTDYQMIQNGLNPEDM